MLRTALGYVTRHGVLVAPAALREEVCIMVIARGRAKLETWRSPSALGRLLLHVPARPPLLINAAAAAVDATAALHGITRLMSYREAAAVAAVKLVIPLEQHEPPPLPVPSPADPHGRASEIGATKINRLGERSQQPSRV